MKKLFLILSIAMLPVVAFLLLRESNLSQRETVRMVDRSNPANDSVNDGSTVAGEASSLGGARGSTTRHETAASPTQNSGTQVVLAEEKQKRIWDSEHATFELETFFGKALRKAILDRDPQAFGEFFTAGATVAILPLSGGQTDQAATVSETRSDASTVQSSDVAGLATQLIESLASINEIQRSKFRVLHLATEDGNHWDARVLLTFAGMASDQRPQLVESRHSLRLTFSGDDEIKAGRLISDWRDESRSTRQSDSVLMREVTKDVGLDTVPLPDNWTRDPGKRSQYWFQIAVADYNQDNYPDIAAATINGDPVLLRSDGGKRFVDVTKEMQLQPWDNRHMEALATWIDFDNDGWPDLLLGNRLYRNFKGQAFFDVTEKSGLRFGHFPMGAAVADYDCDGLVDLYVLYQHPADTSSNDRMPWVGDTKTGAQNQLWHNEGDGRFRDVTEESHAGGGLRHSFAAVWHLLDDDPYPDLYIANDFGQNMHLRNRGDGTFEDISDKAETVDFATSMGATAGDLNNDGRPELYVANMYSKMGRRIIGNVSDDDYPEGIYDQILGSCAGNRLYTMRGDSQSFQEISELAGVNEVGWAYAPTIADFDSDGLLDIYATTGFMSAQRNKPDG